MWRAILIIVALLNLASALFMWVSPQAWYDTVPGVVMTGPFNIHFIRDIALAFLMSAGAQGWGALRADRGVAVTGCAWPCLHALFHVWIWLNRGLPLDQVALVNLLGIQLPAWLALAAAFHLKRKELLP